MMRPPTHVQKFQTLFVLFWLLVPLSNRAQSLPSFQIPAHPRELKFSPLTYEPPKALAVSPGALQRRCRLSGRRPRLSPWSLFQ